MKTKFFISMLALMGLVACSGSKSPHSQETPSLEIPEEEAIVDGKAYAYCNIGTANDSSFKFAVHSYVDGGKVRNDLMYVMLTEFPSDFTTAGQSFRFFRWRVDGSGNTHLDENPLEFRLINPGNGEEILSTRTYVRWSDVASAAAAMSTSTPKEFFRRVFFIVNIKDQLAEYQGLTTAIYSSNGAAGGYAQALLPLFDVDPNGYATTPQGTPRPSVLEALHPYASSKGQQMSLAENLARVQALCAPWHEGI